MTKNTKFKAVIYLRLSKEDGDKKESYSISNQRDLAMDYLKEHPEIHLVCEKVDDGYSGADFNRPQFQEMIKLVEQGKINCVIVKDLSRFAREYVGSGYYLEKLFPSKKIRFISINDGIDYFNDSSDNTKLVIALKNVMNDSYIHDISVKIRSQLEIKRKNYITALSYLHTIISEHDISNIDSILLFKIYSDLELCYKETEDYQNAYIYSEQKNELLEKITLPTGK